MLKGEVDSSFATSSGQETASTIRFGWFIAAAHVLIVAGAYTLFWPTTQSLIAAWEDVGAQTYTHGYIVAAVTLWLLIRNRNQLEPSALRPSAVAAAALVIASLAWLIAYRAGAQVVHQALLLGIMWLALWTGFGWAAARVNAFAIFFLGFAIQVWGAFTPLLQSATVHAVDIMLRASSIPAYISGNFVHLGVGDFEIAGGCSGLHYFIVALTIAALYGEVNRDSLWMRIKLLALAAFFALLTNWVRVYLIVVAGHLTNMQHYLVRVEHYKFGWAVFAVMLVGFFLIARRLPVSAEPAVREAAASSNGFRALTVGTAVAFVAMAAGPAWNSLASGAPALATANLPQQVPGWRGPVDVTASEWRATFVGADASHLASYTDGSNEVLAYTAAYGSQAQGKELVGYYNTLVGEDEAELASGPVPNAALAELLVGKGEQRFVVWYVYEIDGVRTIQPLQAQLRYAFASLVGDPVSRILAVRTRCVSGCEAARDTLSRWWSAQQEAASVPSVLSRGSATL